MGKLINKCRVCEKKGQVRFFLIDDRQIFKKPTDDPRILYLQVDHGMVNKIRLGNHFETARLNLTLTEEQFNEPGKLLKRESWLH